MSNSCHGGNPSSNQVAHFVRAGSHFFIHYNCPSWDDLINSGAAYAFLSEAAACLEQLKNIMRRCSVLLCNKFNLYSLLYQIIYMSKYHPSTRLLCYCAVVF